MKKLLVLLMATLMCFLMCACSSGSDEKKDNDTGDKNSAVDSSKDSNEEANEEKEDENKTIDLTAKDGTIKYVGFEDANSELLLEDADAVVVRFEFTSNKDLPSQCQSVFSLKFYQNGVQLDTNSAYSSKGGDQYELVGNYFSEVMKGGTVTFGRIVKINDRSPITIMASESGSSENYQMMEVDINTSEDNGSVDVPSTEAQQGEVPTTQSSTQPEAKDEVKAIAIGETIETDKFDFTLNKVEITYELKPKNTSGYYYSYTAEDGKVYVHIDGTYLNKSKKDVCIRDLFIATADYDNGYTYDGFVVIDDGDNNFDWVSSYVAATPLESCHYHGLIECPEVIDESDAPLFVTFKIDDVTYRYDIR